MLNLVKPVFLTFNLFQITEMNKRNEAGGKMWAPESGTKQKKKKNSLKEKGYSYRNDIVTTSLYCVCQDCIKYCNYREPVQCIDPFLMDMKHTYWIYQGLVMASKTERAISITVPENTQDKPEENEENATGN